MQQINSIADYLNSEGLATTGQDLFVYFAPPETRNCTILFPSNDPPVIDPDTPGYFIGKFQVITRNSRHSDGMTNCAIMSEALTLVDFDLPEIYIKMCRPLYQPRVFRRAESGLIEFSVTYDIRFIVK